MGFFPSVVASTRLNSEGGRLDGQCTKKIHDRRGDCVGIRECGPGTPLRCHLPSPPYTPKLLYGRTTVAHPPRDFLLLRAVEKDSRAQSLTPSSAAAGAASCSLVLQPNLVTCRLSVADTRAKDSICCVRSKLSTENNHELVCVERNQRRPETTENRSQSWGWVCSRTRSWTTSLVGGFFSRVSQRRRYRTILVCVLLAMQLTAHFLHRHHTILRRPREAAIRNRWHQRAEVRHQRSCSHHSRASTVRRPQ